jgi:hypothetical protein
MNEACYQTLQKFYTRGAENKYKEMRTKEKRILRKKMRRFYGKQNS